MRHHRSLRHWSALVGGPLRDSLLQDALAAHLPGEAWLEALLDRMEARQ